MYKIICKRCNNYFKTDNNIRKFCNDLCYRKYKQEMIRYKKREMTSLKNRCIGDIKSDLKVCFKCHSLFVGRGNYCANKCKLDIDKVESRLISKYRYSSKICLRCGRVLNSNYSTYCIKCSID